MKHFYILIFDFSFPDFEALLNAIILSCILQNINSSITAEQPFSIHWS